MLQNKLRIGYGRSSRLVEQLEQNGILGPDLGGSRGRALVGVDSNAEVADSEIGAMADGAQASVADASKYPESLAEQTVHADAQAERYINELTGEQAAEQKDQLHESNESMNQADEPTPKMGHAPSSSDDSTTTPLKPRPDDDETDPGRPQVWM